MSDAPENVCYYPRHKTWFLKTNKKEVNELYVWKNQDKIRFSPELVFLNKKNFALQVKTLIFLGSCVWNEWTLVNCNFTSRCPIELVEVSF